MNEHAPSIAAWAQLSQFPHIDFRDLFASWCCADQARRDGRCVLSCSFFPPHQGPNGEVHLSKVCLQGTPSLCSVNITQCMTSHTTTDVRAHDSASSILIVLGSLYSRSVGSDLFVYLHTVTGSVLGKKNKGEHQGWMGWGPVNKGPGPVQVRKQRYPPTTPPREYNIEDACLLNTKRKDMMTVHLHQLGECFQGEFGRESVPNPVHLFLIDES